MELQEQAKNEFQIAKDIFVKTGDCKHERKWYNESRPYKCNQTLTMCGVCNKVMFRVYDQ